MERSAVRAMMRERRRRASDPVLADEAAQRFLDAIELPRWSTVAVYVAHEGELDPAPLAAALRGRGHVVAAPVLDGSTLRFAVLDEPTALSVNRFGIAEPAGGEEIAADHLDAVVVPLVAFDRSGTRLGHGLGFYDRALSFRLERDGPPLLVGYAFDDQEVDEIEANATDVPLDRVVTPTRVVDARLDRE